MRIAISTTGRSQAAALLFTILTLILILIPPLSPLRAQSQAAPHISDISPRSVPPGSGDFLLTVRGAGLVPGVSRVAWNGVELAGAACTAAAAPDLASCRVTVPAPLVANWTTAAITVVNPGAGAGPLTSLPAYLTVTTALSPQSQLLGEGTTPDGNPFAIATGDFNRDGKVDVATYNADNTVSAFLGNGAGGLARIQHFPGPDSGLSLNNFLAVDVDEDGTLDLLGVCGQISVFPGNGDGTFRTATTTAASAACQTAATGDFNRDGHLDIAATGGWYTNGTTTLQLFLGDGAGHFTLSDTLMHNAFSWSQSLAVGDFDSDGGLDIIYARGGSAMADPGTLALLSVDAAGAATERWSIAVGQEPEATVADFNGDGRLDVVVNSRSGVATGSVTGSLYFGDGLGAIALSPASPFPIGANRVERTRAADFDGDGFMDLVIDACDSRCFSLFRILRGDGTGAFSGTTVIVPRGWHFALADMNGDGRLDIVTRSYDWGGTTNFSVVPFLQWSEARPSPASIDFGGGKYQTPSAPRAVELRAVGAAPLRINSASATGPFSVGSGSTCPIPGIIAPGTACTIDVIFTATETGYFSGRLTIDTNAWGRTNYESYVDLFGNSTAWASLEPEDIDFGTHALGTPGTPAIVTLRNIGNAAVIPSSMVAAGPFTIDGTSCPALLTPDASCAIAIRFTPAAPGFQTGSLTVNSNASARWVTLRGTALSGVASASPASLTFAPRAIHTSGAAQTVTLTNRDAFPLVISSITIGGAAPHEFAIAGGTCPAGTSTLAPAASCTIDVMFRALSKGTQTASLSIDGSGVDQSVSLSGVGLANGVPFIQQLTPASLTIGAGNTPLVVKGAHFVTGATVLFNGAPLATTVVNGGELTVTIPAASLAAAKTAAVTVRQPVPGGEVSNTAWIPITKAAALSFTRTDLSLQAAPQGLASGDFNGDGLTDLAVAECHDWFSTTTCEPGAVTILLGTSAGPYAAGVRIPLPDSRTAARLVAGDFNGDRRLDLVVSHGSDWERRLTMLVGDGAGAFTVTPMPSTVLSNSTCSVGFLTAADATRDGNLDLVIADPYCNTVALFEGDGRGGLKPAAAPFFAINSAYGYTAPALADLDGDGLLDLVINEATSTLAVTMLKGTGAGTFGAKDAIAFDGYPFSHAVGDVNRDGRPDLVVMGIDVDFINTSVAVYLNDGSGFHNDGSSAFTLAQSLPVAGTTNWLMEPVAPVIADLDGDGRVDIAVAADSGVTIFRGDGAGQFTQDGSSIAVGTGGSPKDLAAVDMNGDGRLDLVVSTSGDTSLTMLVQARALATPVVTFRGAPANAVFMSSFVVTATTDAGVMPAITASGACRVSAVTGTPASARATVSITSGTGACALEATWPETETRAAAVAAQTTAARQTASLTVLSPAVPDPSRTGQPVLVAFAVVGLGLPLPTGSVAVTASTGESCTGALSNFLVGGCTITFNTSGSRTLRASYAGDANFLPSASATVKTKVR